LDSAHCGRTTGDQHQLSTSASRVDAALQLSLRAPPSTRSASGRRCHS